MKTNISILFSVIFLICTWDFFSPPSRGDRNPASSTPDFVGKVEKLTGKVIVVRKNKTEELHSNSKIFNKDKIFTSGKSFARFKMIDNSTLTMGSQSEFMIKDYEVRTASSKTIELNLVRGYLRTFFNGKNKQGSIKVSTKSTVMGVRGTEFITVVRGGEVTVALLEGKVDLMSVAGQVFDTMKPLDLFKSSDLHKKGSLLPRKNTVEELVFHMDNLIDEAIPGDIKQVQVQKQTTKRAGGHLLSSEQVEVIKNSLNTRSAASSDLDSIIRNETLSLDQKKEIIGSLKTAAAKSTLDKIKKIEDKNKFDENAKILQSPGMFFGLKDNIKQQIIKENVAITKSRVNELLKTNKAIKLKKLLKDKEKKDKQNTHNDHGEITSAENSGKEKVKIIDDSKINGTLISNNALGNDSDEEEILIPVVDEDGNVGSVSAIGANGKLIEIPTLPDGEVDAEPVPSPKSKEEKIDRASASYEDKAAD